jgi:lipid-A-disaccharide synthase
MNTNSPPTPQSILIVAGEASGEMYGGELAAALQRHSPAPLRFFGCGGERMREAGVETLVDIHQLAVLGPFEAATHLAHLYRALRQLRYEAARRRPKLAILIDFPDFNLRLARQLKALQIPVIYFISPQIWAWRSGRVRQIKERVERMLVILPFEKEFYSRFGMEVDYVGHPLADRVKTTLSRGDFFEKYGLDPGLPCLSLLPGSRTKEIRYHLPTMLGTAQRLLHTERIQLLIPVAAATHLPMLQAMLAAEAPNLPVTFVVGDTYNAVGHSALAVVASGTATLETALLGVPLISIFRISNLTWIIGQYLVRVPFYCLVNLIAGEKIVPELYQSDFSAERLETEIRKLLSNPTGCADVKMKLAGIRERLGAGGAIERAAASIARYL